jgi:hypothetical protein
VIAETEESTLQKPDVAWIKKHISAATVARELGLEVFGKTKARCWRTENHRNADADPSLRFHIGRNRVRCFVCDTMGGMSVIDLVMGVLGLDFSSAVHWICERFPVPEARRGQPIGERFKWAAHYRVGVNRL